MDTKSSLGHVGFPIEFCFFSSVYPWRGGGCKMETSVVIVYVIGLSSSFNIEVRIAESFVIFGLLSQVGCIDWGFVCVENYLLLLFYNYRSHCLADR